MVETRGGAAAGGEPWEWKCLGMRFSRETKRCRSTEEDIHGDRCRGHRRLRPRCVRRRVPKVWKTDTSPDCGTVDTERFLQYVNDRLIPTLALRALGEPRRIVVLDNASIHKDVRIQNAIEAAGAEVIWTAAYSPDLNPIERCFALYKKVLIRQHRAFRENPHDTHLYALENLNCVSPKIMCNL